MFGQRWACSPMPPSGPWWTFYFLTRKLLPPLSSLQCLSRFCSYWGRFGTYRGRWSRPLCLLWDPMPCVTPRVGSCTSERLSCHPDCCLIAQVFDHWVDGCISKVDVLLLEGSQDIITHNVEDELFACLLGSKVLGVAYLLFLVVCN